MATKFKTCTLCETEKPVEDYYLRDGAHPVARCKKCVIKKTRERYAKNRERYLEQASLRNYGITREDYLLLKEASKESCYICGYGEGPLVLDHNHETGKARAFICRKCNFAVSVAENADYMGDIFQYIEEME